MPITQPGLDIAIYLFKVSVYIAYILISLCILDIIEESPSHSYIESNREQERIPPPEPADPSDSELFEAIRTKNIGLHSAVSAPSTVWFSSHLSELDAQLAALQKIADHLEMDFTTSRMVHKGSCLYLQCMQVYKCLENLTDI